MRPRALHPCCKSVNDCETRSLNQREAPGHTARTRLSGGRTESVARVALVSLLSFFRSRLEEPSSGNRTGRSVCGRDRERSTSSSEARKVRRLSILQTRAARSDLHLNASRKKRFLPSERKQAGTYLGDLAMHASRSDDHYHPATRMSICLPAARESLTGCQRERCWKKHAFNEGQVEAKRRLGCRSRRVSTSDGQHWSSF